MYDVCRVSCAMCVVYDVCCEPFAMCVVCTVYRLYCILTVYNLSLHAYAFVCLRARACLCVCARVCLWVWYVLKICVVSANY